MLSLLSVCECVCVFSNKAVQISPLKVKIITTSQNCPPDTADVLLGSVNSKFMEAF